MYKGIRIKKLGRTASHRKSLKNNQIRSVLRYGAVETTSVKAKVLRGEVERFLSKMSKLDNEVIKLREMQKVVGKSEAFDNAMKLLKSGEFKVTIVKTRFRDGDNAEMSKVTIPGLKKSKKANTPKAKETVKKEVESSTDDKKVVGPKKGSENKIAKSLKQTFTGSKERARSRSGL